MSKRKYFLGFMLTLALVLGLGMAASEVQAGTGTVCGDGVVEGSEECDDFNTVDCDGCDSNCTFSVCGNGIVCAAVVPPGDPNTPGETCDPPGGACDAQCQLLPEPLTKDQQKCVNAINKDALQNVEKTQGKEHEKCLKDYQKDKLADTGEGDFVACATADSKGKVQKKKDKTLKSEDKFCEAPLPGFGYTSGTVANDAAVAASIAVAFNIFGDPTIEDSTFITKGVNKDTAKCQLEMLKRANKLDDTAVKEANKAKKDALKGKKAAAPTTGAELAAALGDRLSSSAKINKAADKLVSGVAKKCGNLAAATADDVFPGVCANDDLTTVSNCVVAATLCEVCLKFETADGIDLDCDQIDNNNADTSCPTMFVEPPDPNAMG